MNLAFFGAFNPPTRAHLELAQFAMKKTGAEKVVFVPSKETYISGEQGKDFAYADDERLAMLRACAASRPWMAVTDWEISQPNQPYTYETLSHLRRDEGMTCALLIGSDKLDMLDRWWHINDLAREFGIVCLVRGTDDCKKAIESSEGLSALAPWIRVVETPAETRSISSTAARQTVDRIRDFAAELTLIVPEEVARTLLNTLIQDL
ncbi:MAG: nicotinate (nicotinamide) nucleotide adenylyltransferase [Clostridia bacterium]|nr:nicotinate (nicotinamide) nucleotide adenylyltransferase [Clostridia bacterium]